MDFSSETVKILLPLIIVAGIAIFVVFRMVDKAKKGTLGRKQSKKDQDILDSLIPFGMIAGLAFALLLSMFTLISMMSAAALGPGLGLLAGYIAYEIYSRY